MGAYAKPFRRKDTHVEEQEGRLGEAQSNRRKDVDGKFALSGRLFELYASLAEVTNLLIESEARIIEEWLPRRRGRLMLPQLAINGRFE